MTEETEAQRYNRNKAPNAIPMPEEKDESFEIISEKEKLWRDFLVTAETNYIKSEASMRQNEAMIELAKIEIKKEAIKNK